MVSEHIITISRSAIQPIAAQPSRSSYGRLGAGLLLSSMIATAGVPALALPPPDDIPEEILRTEIITEARSPVDGRPLTAAEYAELEARLQREPELYNTLSPQIRQLIFLLQIRRTIRTIAPFLLQ
ncbi:hypothetical protein [Thermocoleostomius sinensis]|uniref:Glutathione S-transferase n=1 Tax=Thermocoleostomius sinensis A174 TaxID=2016057 RepID=A0A9E8ZEF5_9CYAN|nr:hypothetical protein [Thermocoleostomius sinensis]WAL61311.1 hypothetical protein OXH18_04750 [Thermocoleostomius sinensis A174]